MHKAPTLLDLLAIHPCDDCRLSKLTETLSGSLLLSSMNAPSLSGQKSYLGLVILNFDYTLGLFRPHNQTLGFHL